MAWSVDPATLARVEQVVARDAGTTALPDVLARRLGVESWMLRLGPDGRWRALTVLEERIAAPVRPAPPAVPSPPPPPVADPLGRPYPLPPNGGLAKLLGTTVATGRQLLELALRQEDPEIRAEAVRVGVDAMMRDPALEATVLDALARTDDATLAAGLTSVAGNAAPGLVALVAERARGSPLGARAAGVLARLGAR